MTLHERAVEVSKVFLGRQGYLVLDDDIKSSVFDILSIDKDDGSIVFIKVIESDENKFPQEHPDRQKFEEESIRILPQLSQNIISRRIRFDIISVATMGEDKAMIRHHTNCIGEM